MKTDDIRRRFLAFFERHAHAVLPSASLVPADDPTLLFTGAGMNQFKDQFLGKGELYGGRAATSQKCLRTGDLEKVGQTPFHHTFFEMLGNFSFGDYFKEGAIVWAWEFLLEDLKLAPERLTATVHQEDDEARRIWETKIGLPPGRVLSFGDHENFWPADAPEKGPNGLCGPCAEIFYDVGEPAGCGRPDCGPNCPHCYRHAEIWNLVFQQFERRDGGVLETLSTKNIDTGAGLERIAAVMQGATSNFGIDIFQPIVREIAGLLEVADDPEVADGELVRRIADHIRAVVFCVSDGILPSNEGRGYVERRLIRRSIGDAHVLGYDGPFLYRLVPIVVEQMKEPYPELVDKREMIGRVVRNEEERFAQTLQQGERLLGEMIGDLKASGGTVLSGDEAFRLFDTYGFPLYMTERELVPHGIQVDEEGFERAMAEQREKARSATRMTDVFDTGPLSKVRDLAEPTDFIGYETMEASARIVAIIRGEEIVEQAAEGDEVVVVLDRTPLYGETGGQVGDQGELSGPSGDVQITDAQRSETHVLHLGRVAKGAIATGDAVTVRVNSERRLAIMRNHTATHLLHHALRQVLGRHVEQSGSLVAPDRFRFDFTHFAAMSHDELERVEELVNEQILDASEVQHYQQSLAEAKKAGAIALFTEKYGEEVRVVNIGDYSRELCGGTHLENTALIGLFRVVGEGSVASGIRRIEAVTGQGALAWTKERETLLLRSAEKLRVPPERLPERIEKILAESKALRKQQATPRRAGLALADLRKQSETIGDAEVLVARVEGASMDDLRAAADEFRTTVAAGALVLATEANGKAQIVVAVSKSLIATGLQAGELIKQIAKEVGGGGGGRPDLAQAGGKNVEAIDAALDKARRLLQVSLGEA